MTPASRYALASFRELPEHVKDNEFILGHYQRQLAARRGRPQRVPSAQRDAQRLDAFDWDCRWPILWRCLRWRNFSAYSQGQPLLVQDQYLLLKELLLGTNSLANLNWMSDEEMKIGSLQSAATRWSFFVFLGGSMFCLLLSSICHLFSCHSHYLNIQLLQMDYVGIMVMIITSFFPPIYCIFQCEPHWQLIYLGGITAMVMFTVVTLLAPSLSSGKFWAFRAMRFSSMGFFSIVPAILACIVNWSNPQYPITLAYESAMALSYITGTLFMLAGFLGG